MEKHFFPFSPKEAMPCVGCLFLWLSLPVMHTKCSDFDLCLTLESLDANPPPISATSIFPPITL